MNKIAHRIKGSTIRFAVLIVLVFTLMYVGYNQLEAQNLVTCPGLVQQAIDAVGNNCGSLSRNSACYGFEQVERGFSPAAADRLLQRTRATAPACSNWNN